MKSNNYYLRQIAINFGLETPNKFRNDNWYLKKICELSEGFSDESIEEDLLE